MPNRAKEAAVEIVNLIASESDGSWVIPSAGVKAITDIILAAMSRDDKGLADKLVADGVVVEIYDVDADASICTTDSPHAYQYVIEFLTAAISSYRGRPKEDTVEVGVFSGAETWTEHVSRRAYELIREGALQDTAGEKPVEDKAEKMARRLLANDKLDIRVIPEVAECGHGELDILTAALRDAEEEDEPEDEKRVREKVAALNPDPNADPLEGLHKFDLAIRASERQRAAGIVSNHIYGYPGTITDQLHKAVLAAILDGAEAEDAITQKVPSIARKRP